MKTIASLIITALFISCGISAQNCNDNIHTGEITFYEGIQGTSGGNCSLPVAADDFMHCALNNIDYDGSNACGACLEVTGSKGTVIVQVVDRCPECAEGDVDLTEQAFEKVENPIDGRVQISWKFIECPINKTIKVNFKEENRFFNAFQFRDIKHAISKMEYREKETDPWKQVVDRKLFNFFIESSEITYPIDIRVTSILGEKLIFKDIIQRPPSQEFDTQLQFSTPPECAGVLSTDSFNKKEVKPFTIYPNPTSGLVNVNRDFESWSIFSSNGSSVKEGTSKEIDTSDLSKGIYFLVIDRQVLKLEKK